MNTYDSIIIGGGPAGLSAAIYLGRFNRACLVIDAGHGRTWSHEVNDNFLGFPDGISSKVLRALGEQQARRFNAEFNHDRITSVSRESEVFVLKGTEDNYKARTLILATGVKDVYPEAIENIADYIGRSLYWCITCDGYKVRGKNVMIVGDNDDAACTATQFLNFTDSVTFVTNQAENEHTLSAKWMERLLNAGIKFYEGKIAAVQGIEGMFETVTLDNGQQISLEYMFNQQPALPNNSIAKELGLTLSPKGYIETNEEQRTNVPFVYAAGDVTRPYSHQIITAAHEGSMAAQAANYDIYKPEQRMD
jgi:thioredoxin reductase (NADPH)